MKYLPRLKVVQRKESMIFICGIEILYQVLKSGENALIAHLGIQNFTP